eukprot:TRINITY_DN238_c0_g2_i1.p1 TRINITY_DN238_c0_g2~~TRINITY_DN238_c0_g2_i1.p1  ORF type:complete len:311 (-),score=108.90 TRINITY_DN238_c0_g2_i1:27-959(-)
MQDDISGKSEFAEERSKLIEEHKAEIEKLLEKHEKEKNAIKANYESGGESMEMITMQAHQDKISTMETSQRDMTAKFEEEKQRLISDFEAEKQKLLSDFETQLINVKSENSNVPNSEEERSKIKKQLEIETRERLEKEFAATSDGYKQEIAKLKQAESQNREDVEAMKREMTEKLQQYENRITELQAGKNDASGLKEKHQSAEQGDVSNPSSPMSNDSHESLKKQLGDERRNTMELLAQFEEEKKAASKVQAELIRQAQKSERAKLKEEWAAEKAEMTERFEKRISELQTSKDALDRLKKEKVPTAWPLV